MNELVLGPGVDPSDPRALEAFLARQDLAEADRASLRRNAAALCVYRHLVRSRLREAIELAVPRTLARLGSSFEKYFERFLDERGPRTHYLRDVTREWLEFCAPLWAEDARVPAYLIDLAWHEALEIIVASGADAAPVAGGPELDLERGLSFIEAARVVRYRYAVHELSEDPRDTRAPRASPTALFVYRSPEHDVRYLELTPLAAAILERLLRGETLGAAVTLAAREAGAALDTNVLEGASRLLSELAARGALLGAAPAKAGASAKLALSQQIPADSGDPNGDP